MSTRKSNFFWASYADLMTALFVVLLALFVLSYKLFKDENHKLEEANTELAVMAVQFQKIKEIEAALGALEGEYFKFDSTNKRHELVIPIEFAPSSSIILPKYFNKLEKAGRTLKNTIKGIKIDQPVRYIVIIEGMAAKYNDIDQVWRNNDKRVQSFAYNLSYQRALALFRFWEERGISFDKDKFEIIIAGSGFYGAGRYQGREEERNKRFLIQVIPKVGKIGG